MSNFTAKQHQTVGFAGFHCMKNFEGWKGILSNKSPRYEGWLGMMENVFQEWFETVGNAFGDEFKNEVAKANGSVIMGPSGWFLFGKWG